MKSFESHTLENLPLTHNIVRSVGLLHEYKGREGLFEQQAPQVLQALREAAAIQSTVSSNRIEGITAPPDRIKALVVEKTAPKNRSEEEIAGYRDVLATIHTSQEGMPFTVNLVLQLHRDLFRYVGGGGKWKSVDNSITERLPDGTEHVRFQPVPAFQTPEYMKALHERFDRLWNRGGVDRLLLIPAYVLDFLCIHPFLDGNGRMARLLTLLLLYKGGFGMGRYISLEMLIERTRESYYDTLHASSQEWHESRHTLQPWTEYFLGILTAAYSTFEERVGMMRTAPGAKTQMVVDAVQRLPGGFRISELERACPSVSRDMIRVVLNRLREEGKLRLEGAGGGAKWYREEAEW